VYRKFSADQIFNGHTFLPGKPVIIIDEGGTITDITDLSDAGGDVQQLKGIICPGFINVHCHVELSHLKGQVPEGTGLVQFVQQIMSKRGLQHSPEQKQVLMKAAIQQMYNSGIVAVGDICNTSDSITAKQTSSLHWHNFIELTGFVGATAEKRFADMQIIKEQFLQAGHKQNHFNTTLAPHAPYSVSRQLFALINEATAEQVTTIHNQETAAENELYQSKAGGFLELYQNIGIDISSFNASGKTSLQSWLPYLNRQQAIITVHNNFTSQADIDFVMEIKKDVSFCICINANRYIEQINPPIALLMKNNCKMVLGTDSLASNHQLNIWEEIKTIRQQFPSIGLATLLQWATSNGAATLQMNDRLGIIEKGKQPGLVLIEKPDDLQHSTAKRID